MLSVLLCARKGKVAIAVSSDFFPVTCKLIVMFCVFSFLEILFFFLFQNTAGRENEPGDCSTLFGRQPGRFLDLVVHVICPRI